MALVADRSATSCDSSRLNAIVFALYTKCASNILKLERPPRSGTATQGLTDRRGTWQTSVLEQAEFWSILVMHNILNGFMTLHRVLMFLFDFEDEDEPLFLP